MRSLSEFESINRFPEVFSDQSNVALNRRKESSIQQIHDEKCTPRTKKTDAPTFQEQLQKIVLHGQASQRTTSENIDQQEIERGKSISQGAISNGQETRKGKPNDVHATRDAVKRENAAAVNSADQVLSEEKSDTAVVTALPTLVESLQRICTLLGLTLNDRLTTDTVRLDDQSIENLAEIVSVCSQLIETLRQALKSNVQLAVPIGDTTNNSIGMAKMVDALSVELNTLKVALKSLGIAGQVARKASEIGGNPLTDGGVVQAADPRKITSALEMKSFVAQMENTVVVESQKIKKIIDSLALSISGETNKLQSPTGGSKPGIPSSAPQSGLTTAQPLSSASGQPSESGFSGSENQGSMNQGSMNQGSMNQGLKNQGLKNQGFENVTGLKFLQTTSNDENPQESSSTRAGNLTGNLAAFSKIVQKHSLGETNSASRTGLNEIMNQSGPPAMIDVKNTTSIPSPKTADMNIITTLAEKMVHAVKNNVQQVQIHLKPDYLGSVRLTIQMESDTITARINVENQQVKQIIESSLPHLRTALEEHNFRSGNFEVTVGGHDQNDPRDQKQFDHRSAMTDNDSSQRHGGALDDEVEHDMATHGTDDTSDTGRRFGYNTIEFVA
ncbi:MAG: flagellar hook-length control protein FliK [Chitinivibrionales bacterium]|nr:flagellar hook-length control protein FliK [Chitinivibrionales bacterium]